MDEIKKAELKSFARISDLEDSPIEGNFDSVHLQAIHAYIFQDSPQHSPGQFRPDVKHAWTKNRVLESNGLSYLVPYCRGKFIPKKLTQALRNLKTPAQVSAMDATEFSSYLGSLYGDLDYIHPFSEGNSRTLRTFTRLMARHWGIDLDWSASNANAASRDQLYMARDIEVLKRAYPNLSAEYADSLPDVPASLDYYQAYNFGLKLIEHSMTLAQIITQYVQPQFDAKEKERVSAKIKVIRDDGGTGKKKRLKP